MYHFSLSLWLLSCRRAVVCLVCFGVFLVVVFFFGGVEVMVRGCDCGLVGVLVRICISAFLLVSASVSVSKTIVPLIFNERRASDGLVICQVFQVLVRGWSEREEA